RHHVELAAIRLRVLGELNVPVHEEDVRTAGNVVELCDTTLYRNVTVDNGIFAVGQRVIVKRSDFALRFGAASGIVDVRDQEALDTFFENLKLKRSIVHHVNTVTGKG